MNKNDVQLLFAYNRWANAQTLASVAPLTEEQFKTDLATSHKSVHGTLTHTLAAEWIWLMRCEGTSPLALFDPADFPGVDSLRARWEEVEDRQRTFVEALSEEQLAISITYTNTAGERWKYELSHIFQHVVNHSSYHRGQVAAMLRQLGATPISTDLLYYVDTIQATRL